MSTTADELLQSEKRLTAELATHETIMVQLMKHEDRIIQNMENLNTLKTDVAGPGILISAALHKQDIKPIVRAVGSLCFFVKGFLIFGTIAAATVAFIELWEHLPLE